MDQSRVLAAIIGDLCRCFRRVRRILPPNLTWDDKANESGEGTFFEDCRRLQSLIIARLSRTVVLGSRRRHSLMLKRRFSEGMEAGL